MPTYKNVHEKKSVDIHLGARCVRVNPGGEVNMWNPSWITRTSNRHLRLEWIPNGWLVEHREPRIGEALGGNDPSSSNDDCSERIHKVDYSGLDKHSLLKLAKVRGLQLCDRDKRSVIIKALECNHDSV